jgi:hypothetical protein
MLRLFLYLPLIVRLRRGGYDWLHVHFVSQGVVGLAAGRPFFIHAHGSDLRLNPRLGLLRVLNRRVLDRAIGIFHVTPELRPLLGRHASRSRWLPNPISDRYFADGGTGRLVRKALIFVRLDPIKAPERIFDVTGPLAEIVELTAIRWGVLAAEYEARWGDEVHFIERVPPATVKDLLAGFDLVIGQMGVGVLGLSELEAMAGGLVVVMNLEAGLYEGEPPPVLATEGGVDLVAKVRLLVADPAEIGRRVEAGREWVRRHHSFASHLALLETAYRETGLRARGS